MCFPLKFLEDLFIKLLEDYIFVRFQKIVSSIGTKITQPEKVGSANERVVSKLYSATTLTVWRCCRGLSSETLLHVSTLVDSVEH